MSFKFDSAGVRATLTQVARRSPQQVGAALKAECEIEMTEAKRKSPVDEGTMRASGYVGEPEQTFTGVSVEMGFGGAAADYVVVQHEDLELHHDVGEAKFLESTMDESAPHMAARVGRRLNLAETVGS